MVRGRDVGVSPAGKTSPLWLEPPAAMEAELRRRLDPLGSHGGGCTIFFRADDVGVPGSQFARLVDLFRRHQVPLTLALVPAWLTARRWRRLVEISGRDPVLLGWVQHGWRHRNHAPQGKKEEFGPTRPFGAKRKDLLQGFERLGSLVGEALLPIFVPPWNRCDGETLMALRDLGFKALSRSLGAWPAAPPDVPDYPVTVDLHTRTEENGEAGRLALLKELSEGLSRPLCGIMIHHQRMNEVAFAFLDLLLQGLTRWRGARLVHLGNLLGDG
jgi:peptidoglycan/xylan/chitin deacetylase (PgdA/CDA1 family)